MKGEFRVQKKGPGSAVELAWAPKSLGRSGVEGSAERRPRSGDPLTPHPRPLLRARSPSLSISSIRPRRSSVSWPNCGSRSRSRSIPRRPNIWPRWAETGGHVVRLERTERPGICRSARRRASGTSSPTATLAALKPILEDPAVEKIGQNLKYDMIVLRGRGHRAGRRGLRHDGRQLPARSRAAATTISTNWPRPICHHETIKISELIGTGKEQRRMDEVPVRQVADYAGEDAWLPVRLRPILAEKLDEAELAEPARSLELPLIDVLVEIGVQRHQGRRGPAGRTEPPLRPADGDAGAGNLPDGGPAVQHRLAQAASGAAVHAS